MTGAPETRPARFAIAVASGKGGVGKSTVSLNLALALAEQGRRVGLLDADFYGPDIPLMVNLKRTERLERWHFWSRAGAFSFEPVERHGIQIMSVGFFLAEQQAFALPAQWTHFVSRQLVYEVAWDGLDFLLIDLPPGLGDLQQELVRLLPLDGAVVVVGPQDVAHLDAKKLFELLVDSGVPVLGAVENMTTMACPHCGKEIDVFPPVRPERSLWALDVPRLARIPLDPSIARGGDGRPVVVVDPAGPQAQAFHGLARAVEDALDQRPDSARRSPDQG
jgi:ATP-binding protein involved in chromosome partitioning